MLHIVCIKTPRGESLTQKSHISKVFFRQSKINIFNVSKQ
jgi:hypothetical protein